MISWIILGSVGLTFNLTHASNLKVEINVLFKLSERFIEVKYILGNEFLSTYSNVTFFKVEFVLQKFLTWCFIINFLFCRSITSLFFLLFVIFIRIIIHLFLLFFLFLLHLHFLLPFPFFCFFLNFSVNSSSFSLFVFQFLFSFHFISSSKHHGHQNWKIWLIVLISIPTELKIIPMTARLT